MRYQFGQSIRRAMQIRTVLVAAVFALLTVSASVLPLSPGSTLSAQDVGQTTGGFERHPSQLTDAQYAKLRNLESRVKPGLYKIRVIGSGNCLVFKSDGESPSNSDPDTIRTGYCNFPNYQNITVVFYVLPHREGYTLRAARSLFGAEDDRYRFCATAGRGVLIGPRPIAFDRCGIGSNASAWEDAGDADQIFSIVPVGSGNLYELKPNAINGDCVSIEGGSTNLEARAISWACNSQSDQKFELIPHGTAGNAEAALIAKHGWLLGSDGYQRISPAGGVDMPGGNYTEFETIADSGKYCASACVSNGAQCKGFTWTAAGFDRPKPMCQLKSSLTPPINRGASSTNQIISAIVRR